MTVEILCDETESDRKCLKGLCHGSPVHFV